MLSNDQKIIQGHVYTKRKKSHTEVLQYIASTQQTESGNPAASKLKPQCRPYLQLGGLPQLTPVQKDNYLHVQKNDLLFGQPFVIGCCHIVQQMQMGHGGFFPLKKDCGNRTLRKTLTLA